MKRPSESIASCDDGSCELLISPIPRPRVRELRVSVRPKRRRVRFLDARKPNSLAILRQAGELLRAQGIEVEPEIRIKDDPSRPLDAGVLDWIARDEGLILCGVAD
ncbi:MAG TPA: hypothetical protein VK932_28495 [Kofleriaceae bacterium]|nr:hypothetical protein [Kofleriaceae bacterium]